MTEIVFCVSCHLHGIAVEGIILKETFEQIIDTVADDIVEQNDGLAALTLLLGHHNKAWQMIGWDLDKCVARFLLFLQLNSEVGVFVLLL